MIIKKYSKKILKNPQQYEKYWALTLGHTDIHSTVYSEVLKCIKDYIDQYKQNVLVNKNYSSILQEEVLKVAPKSAKTHNNELPSARKEINSFIKLGFVEPKLTGTHPLVDNFLSAKTNRRRTNLFSRIVAENSKIQCSVSKNSDRRNYLLFLFETLEEVGQLNKEDLAGLMTCDIDLFKKGFLTRVELDKLVSSSKTSNFLSRKYNQIRFLGNVLSKMTEIIYVDGLVRFKEDVKKEEYPYDLRETGRSQYKQRIYKDELMSESEDIFGEPRCMVDNKTNGRKNLRASHIKRWAICKQGGLTQEEFDPYNGLLLEKSIDTYFDSDQITFDDTGFVIMSSELQPHIREKLKYLKINDAFLNEDRLGYIKWHRENRFRN